MVVKVRWLLARRIGEAREGMGKLREDIIDKRGPESIGVRWEPIKNKPRDERNTVVAHGCGERQR